MAAENIEGNEWSFTTGGKAYDPIPRDGFGYVIETDTLSWTGESFAASFDVYFGSCPSPPLVPGGPQGAANYDPPGDMAGATTYCWRIDQRNAGGAVMMAGDIWSFTTLDSMAGSLVVDLSGNGKVGFEDLKILTDFWLDVGCSAPGCVADLDGIAGVNMADYAFLAADWGWRSISVQEYIDKMKGGWVGQMVGVSWGAPTEFQYQGVIMPEGAVPVWESGWINDAFWQDDLYVEMTFLRSLELYGLDVSIIQAGNDFADSSYALWHANRYGRENLRNGIAPPDSGHPEYNGHADDIDYQIEADYSGLISPGLPNSPIALGEKFGRLMNYGDGLYAGQFIGGMYAEAFFETDMETIVRAGLECIPVGSQYHECISDVLTWYGANPNWEDTWELINNKYHLDQNYRRFSCDTGAFNIDAKINGAYVVMGLLYGQGDPDDTITISMRCGQDSDCNPSSAAGILFTSIGYSNLPPRFKALNEETYFSYTDYNFPLLMGVCEDLARQVVLQAGGSRGEDPYNPGEEIFIIPVSSPVPSALLQSWDPDPPIIQY